MLRMTQPQITIWSAALAGVLTLAAPAAAESPSAVVLMYHRFGENSIPSTNIRLEQLDAHIAYLKDGGFSVLPLADVVTALQAGSALPPKSVAITIDDAYASVAREAWPRFKRSGFPFTVFVATKAVDDRERGIMSWDQIRALADDGVGIGGHGHAHAHMPALSLEAVRADLATMNRRFVDELGAKPTLFAYPFGETGEIEKQFVREAGYVAAFGSNSGPVYGEADMFFLPRFALNENYGAMDRFKLVTNTLPLRAVDVRPRSSVLAVNPPIVSFRVVDGPELKQLSCFGPNGTRLPLSIGADRVTVSPGKAFPPGRSRVNCTVRAAGRWHWWGHEMIAGGVSEGVAVHPRHLTASDE